MLSITRDEDIALVRLDRGVTNAIDLELVTALETALGEARDDPETRGVVLGSANDKFLSIGFDIPNLFPLDREGFGEFYRAFNRMFIGMLSSPKPIVASITGHAIAGGCVLVLGCDGRIIADGRKLMGLNEVKLGVPVPYAADRVLRSLVAPAHAREIMEDGEFFEPAMAFEMGLVDDLRPVEEVWQTAVERARHLGSHPGGAWPVIKRNRLESVLADVEANLEAREETFLDCWFADDTRAMLEEAMENF